MRLPKDKFIIGWVAANSDKEPRKGWTQGFEGIKYFLEQNPDAAKDLFVFCHTNPMDERGLNLQALKDYLGLNKFVYFENPMVSQTGIRDEELAMIYNSSDIMLNPSRREGFGLPIIEAMACGTPVVGTNFSAMTELIEGKGWLAKVAIRDITPIMAITAIPDPHSIADCIEDAYNNPNKILQYGKKASEFAKQYDWDLIIENNWIPFLNNVVDDLKPKTIEERQLI